MSTHSYSNQDTIAASWETGSSKYRLVSCYRCLTILGYDSNHTTRYRSTDIKERGELLFNYLPSKARLLCNREETSRRY